MYFGRQANLDVAMWSAVCGSLSSAPPPPNLPSRVLRQWGTLGSVDCFKKCPVWPGVLLFVTKVDTGNWARWAGCVRKNTRRGPRPLLRRKPRGPSAGAAPRPFRGLPPPASRHVGVLPKRTADAHPDLTLLRQVPCGLGPGGPAPRRPPMPPLSSPHRRCGAHRGFRPSAPSRCFPPKSCSCSTCFRHHSSSCFRPHSSCFRSRPRQLLTPYVHALCLFPVAAAASGHELRG